jgi:hypothetical protein
MGFAAPRLNANTAALQRMLQDAGHRVSVAGKCWNIDNKMAYWPETGRYKFSLSRGGASGEIRGVAESTFEKMRQMLRAV